MKHFKQLFTMEVGIEENFNDEELTVILSLPGRDGTMIRRWPIHGEQIETPQWLDLQSWVAGSIGHALFWAGGSQEVLQLSEEPAT